MLTAMVKNSKINCKSNFSFSNQLNSYFAIQVSPERKQREKIFTWQWRNSKEKERLKENGGQMKRQVKVNVYENLKLGDYLPIKFKKLSKML